MMNKDISEEEKGKIIYNNILKEIHLIDSLENDKAIGLLLSSEAYYLFKKYLEGIGSPFMSAGGREYFLGCKVLLLNALSGVKAMILTKDLIKRNLVGELLSDVMDDVC